MDSKDRGFSTFPDPPPGGFVEDPDFKYIDEEERELIEWVESVEWRPIENQEEAIKYFQEVARRTMDERANKQSQIGEATKTMPNVAD